MCASSVLKQAKEQKLKLFPELRRIKTDVTHIKTTTINIPPSHVPKNDHSPIIGFVRYSTDPAMAYLSVPLLLICIRMFVKFSYFANFPNRTSTFRQNRKYSDAGNPARHIGLGLGAIRAL